MNKKFKLSKYNFIVRDHEDNIIIYNFLTGIKSLSIILKSDEFKFNDLFLNNKEIILNDAVYDNVKRRLCDIGFLVNAEENEDGYCDTVFYKEVFESGLKLTIMPTGECDFGCGYCYESFQSLHRGVITKESQTNLLRFIQKNAEYYTDLRVAWFGGEPLLASDEIKYLSENILKICDVKHLSYTSEITTNGYNLNIEMFDMLYNLKVYLYQITVDGLKEQHDKQRVKMDGSGTFDRIIANLIQIRNNKKYKLAKICIRVNTTTSILSNIDEFIDFYDRNFAFDERFDLVFSPATDFEKGKNPNEINQNAFSFQKGYINNDYLNSFIYSNEKYKEKMIGIDSKIDTLNPSSMCVSARKNYYVIGSDLTVYKCCVHFDFTENKLGFINHKGDIVIDDMLHRKWFTKKCLPKECSSCYYLPCCNSKGCPLEYNWYPDRLNCFVKKVGFENILKQNILSVSNHFRCFHIKFNE